jgi:NAD(P)-dependent dehydrogenase (short-subunit alcohol dehydrogenase family)
MVENMINPMSLENKRILVTGASSGIGRAVAIQCSLLGANVVLAARSEEKLRETMSYLPEGKHALITCDLSGIEQIEKIMDACIECGDKLDGLVHSAGVCPMVPLRNLKYEKMLEAMNINYFAFMELAKLYSGKKYSNGGSIVAISSVSSFAGLKGASLYCGSKGALDSSVRELALELAEKNIRVNTVVPSNIKTGMYYAFAELLGEEWEAGIAEKQPLGIGRSEDVANAAAFLLSDAARFITGTSLVVDGGYLAQ